MNSLDNLSIGDYVAVIGTEYESERCIPRGFDVVYIPSVAKVNPVPMRVFAINAPFALCKPLNGQNSTSIDCRHEQWTKLGKDFVREFCLLNDIDVPDDVKTAKDKRTDKERRKGNCPMCGGAMSERKHQSHGWVMMCRTCEIQMVPIDQ